MYPKTQALIADYLSEGVFPGVNYGFIHASQTFTKTLGYRQVLPTKEKLRDDTLFDVASLTKVIGTTSLVLKLWEEGRIQLDHALQRYLPAFNIPEVTLRHLLTHTSNLNGYIPNRDQLSAAELRHALLNLQPGEKIGQEVVYTDSGTLLLGFLIEAFYHQAVQHVITAEVLTPLGMTASSFQPSHPNVAATEVHPQRGLIKGTVHDPKASVLKETCGSAGLFATLADCLTFCQMILAGGKTKTGQQFLQPSTIARLFSDQTPSKTLKRSLGWDLIADPLTGRPLIFHTGYTGTFLLIDLYTQEAFVFLSNRVHPLDKRDTYLLKRDNLIQLYLTEKAH